jgi:hypothetical protein
MTSSYIPRGMVSTGAGEARREAATQEALTTAEAVSADDRLRAQQEARRDELEAEDAAQQQGQLQQAEQAAGAQPMGLTENLAEAGGAIAGGAIDAMESVGGTAEKLLTGQIADPNFKPTWLQVADEKEPLTRTIWGSILRGVAEYGTLAVLTRKAAKGAKAMRVPGTTALSNGLNADKATSKAGKLTRMATKGVLEGAAVDFMTSFGDGETLSNNLKELMPWLPTPLAVEDDDTPLERRAKNMLEGVGIGLVGELALGWRRASVAAKAMKLPPESKLKQYQQLEKDYNKVQKALNEKEVAFRGGQVEGKLSAEEKAALRADPEYAAAEQLSKAIKKQYTDLDIELDPKSKGEARIARDADSRQANFDEKVRNALADDPDGLEPNAWVNSPLFDRPDKALFTPATGNGYFKNLRDSFVMATDPIQANGRRVSVYTESALEKRLAQFDPDRRRIIEEVAKGIDVELNEAAVAEAAGQPLGNFTVKQLKDLSTARYLDLLDEVVANPDDLEGLKKMLTEGAVDPRDRTNAFTGTKERFLGLIDHRAVEMLIHTTAGEISDLATVARTLDGTLDNSRSVDALINRMKFMLAETGRAKYISGFDLQGLKANAAEMPARLQQIDLDVDASLKDLRKIFDTNPELARGFLDAAVLANGSPKSLNDMYEVLKSRFSMPGFRDLFDGSVPTEQSNELIRQLQAMSINGILSGPRTIARATLGNGLMIYTRPVMTALGGLVTGDRKGFAMGMASMEAAMSATTEAWKAVRNAIVTNMNGEMNIGSRFAEQTGGLYASRAEWQDLGRIINQGAETAPKVWYGITNALFNFNSWIGVKYPSVVMKGLDDGTSVIMSRVDAKLRAFNKAWDETGGKDMGELVNKYTDEFLNNQDPTTLSAYAQRMAEEASLRLPLPDHMKRLEAAFSIPAVKPFFLFMQTGYNALDVVRKHTPILATFSEEYRTVMSATPDNLDKVRVLGINDPGQLLEAQMLMKGRVAAGHLAVGSAISLYLSGKLTGNGPMDREERDVWSQTGWQARSIKLGDVWMDYSALEPFNSFLSAVADIGDNANKLGEPATQNFFQKLSWMVAQNVTNKSFLQGVVDLGGMIDAISSGSLNRIGTTTASQLNSLIPWAGARRELANVFNPGMRELDYDIQSTFQRIQNANPYFKGELPAKYDILDGSLVGWTPPIHRLVSIGAAGRLSYKDSPTRRTLRESGYDVVRKFRTDSHGNKLTPEQRSKMQLLIGQQNLEGQLEKLFAKPAIKAEMESYARMRDMGVRSRGEGGDKQYGLDVSDTKFYQAIDTLFSQAQKRAEAQLHQEYPNLRRAAVERRAVEIQQQEGRPDAALQRVLNYQNK